MKPKEHKGGVGIISTGSRLEASETKQTRSNHDGDAER